MKIYLVVYSDYDVHSIESAWFDGDAANEHLKVARQNDDDMFRNFLDIEEIETSDHPIPKLLEQCGV